MKNRIFIILMVLASGLPFSCEPERAIYDDEVLITLGSTTGNYYVKEENNTYSLPVWLLRPANEDISVTLTVDEEASTAVEGEDFTIVEQTVVIPAGELSADFEISSDFAGASIEGEMVKFNLSSDDADLTQFRNDFTLNIRKACSLAPLPGTFDVTSEFFGDFPVEVVAGAAENELILKDYYSAGRDIRVIVNEDFTVTVPKQVAWVSNRYGDASLASRSGSRISPCEGILTLVLEHTVAAGTFGTYTDLVVKQTAEEPTEGEGDGTDGDGTDGEGTDGEGTDGDGSGA